MEYQEVEYETLPENVKEVIEEFSESNGSYKDCEKLITKLNKIGWTAEYGLDAEPYNFRKV